MKRCMLIAVAVLVLASSAALADTYTLTYSYGSGSSNIFTSTDGGTTWSQHGSTAYVTGPYYMYVQNTIPGSPSILMPLICLDGAVDLKGGTWEIGSANISQQALWIGYNMLTGGMSGTELIGMQFAVWQLADPIGRLYKSNDGTIDAAMADWLDLNKHPIGSFGYTIFNPVDPKINQRFEGVPEPSLLILLGIAILAVGPISLLRK